MPDEWICAAEALRIVTNLVGGQQQARRAICTRAHAGLINARAERFLVQGRSAPTLDVPAGFWWAKGEAALQQNWATGDFATWIDRKRHFQAFGVSFLRAGIDSLVGPARDAPSWQAGKSKGGRPAAAWWDDLWVEIARQLYDGDLKPKAQADIETAMKDWAATHGESPADSTIRPRARKLWTALNKNGKN